MNYTHYIRLLFLALILPSIARAQYNDFAVWQSITLKKNINNKFGAELSEKIRYNENATILHYLKTSAGISYLLHPAVSFSLNYSYIYRLPNFEESDCRHRFYFETALKKKWENLSFAYRGILLMQYNNFLTTPNGMVPSFVERNKITIKYNTVWVSPYVAAELFLPLTGPRAMLFNRTRYFAGLLYELNKVQELELYFLYEHNYMSVNPEQKYVIGMGYTHTFY